MALRKGITVIKEIGDIESCWIDRGNGKWERILTNPSSSEGSEDDVKWNEALAILYTLDARNWFLRTFAKEPENMRYGPDGKGMIQVGKPETVYVVRSGLRRSLIENEADNFAVEQIGNNLYVVKMITKTTAETRVSLANIGALFQVREDRLKAMGAEAGKETIDATFAKLVENNVLTLVDDETNEEEDPEKGHVYLLSQIHFSAWAEGTDDDISRIYQVYQAMYALHMNRIATFVEGTGQDQSALRSTESIHQIDQSHLCEEIQEQLFGCDNIDGFTNLMKQISKSRGKQGTKGLQPIDFLLSDTMYGVEDISLLEKMDDMILRSVKAKSIRSEMGLKENSELVLQEENGERYILVDGNAEKYTLTKAIENIRYLHEWSKEMIKLSADREEAVVQYAKELVANGVNAVIVYGLAHGLSLKNALREIANVHSYKPAKMTQELSEISVDSFKKEGDQYRLLLERMQELHQGKSRASQTM